MRTNHDQAVAFENLLSKLPFKKPNGETQINGRWRLPYEVTARDVLSDGGPNDLYHQKVDSPLVPSDVAHFGLTILNWCEQYHFDCYLERVPAGDKFKYYFELLPKR